MASDAADSVNDNDVGNAIFVYGGNDSVLGNGGDDDIFGGDGNDTLIGGTGNDYVDGDWDGRGGVDFGHGADSIDGGDGNDSVYGEDGNDTLLGGNGNDDLQGGHGIDSISGGAGEDTIYGDDGIAIPDSIGGWGGDSLDGGDGNDSIYAGGGADTILGGAGNDYLWGDFPDTTALATGNDSIDGGAGNDTLNGESGNDTLAGGTGANVLYGGAGDDTYVVSSLDDQIYDSQGTNHVVVAIDGYKAPSGTAFDAPEFIDGAQQLPYFIDALYNGTRWGTFGSTVTLTYSFLTAVGPQSKPADAASFQPITDSDERQVIIDALASWSAVANIKFVAQADGSASDLRFGKNEQTGSAGYATLPDGSNGDSEIYFNIPHVTGDSGTSFDGVVDWVVLHEIGHALGLKHPFDVTNTGGSDILDDGVHDAENTVHYTLMAYNDRSSETTLQEYDIAAIQYLYGPKTGTNAGATTYTFATHWVSDASGIDTFSAAAQTQGVHLDINDGRWNWVNAQSAKVEDAGQSFINFNTFIEKALGGSGNDTIIGNELGNTLTGNAGDDSMSGGAGNDTFTGSAGNDTLAGGAGDDVYKAAKGDVIVEAAGEGNDRVEVGNNWVLGANVEDLTLTGYCKTGTGNDLGNHILGNGSANTLNGGNGDDTLDGAAGADKLSGGAGNDTFVWDSADAFDLGAGGTDTLVLGGSQSLDLTLIDNSIITGMERITLGGTNTLTLAGADLTALSTSTDTLYVDGDAGDNVYLSGAWTHNANPVAGYDIWKSGVAVLRVDSDIHVSLLGA
jgi:serralysin